VHDMPPAAGDAGRQARALMPATLDAIPRARQRRSGT
jgi:hypothetical protein